MASVTQQLTYFFALFAHRQMPSPLIGDKKDNGKCCNNKASGTMRFLPKIDFRMKNIPFADHLLRLQLKASLSQWGQISGADTNAKWKLVIKHNFCRLFSIRKALKTTLAFKFCHFGKSLHFLMEFSCAETINIALRYQ